MFCEGLAEKVPCRQHPVICLLRFKGPLDLQNSFSCDFFVFLLIGSHEGGSPVCSGVLGKTCKTTSKEKRNWSRNCKKEKRKKEEIIYKAVARSVALASPLLLLGIIAKTPMQPQTPYVGGQWVQRGGLSPCLLPPMLKGLLLLWPHRAPRHLPETQGLLHHPWQGSAPRELPSRNGCPVEKQVWGHLCCVETCPGLSCGDCALGGFLLA